jgi:hypothetical protein
VSETPELVEQEDGGDFQTDEVDMGAGSDETDTGEQADIEEATVELTDDDFGEGLFDGVESADQTGNSPDKQQGEPESIAAGLEGNSAAMEDAINEGAARLSVVGLTEQDFADSDLDKESLEDEFQETFEAFRLGYFGSRAVEEYFLKPADHEVSPIWGLMGSALIGAAMVVWLRPDGDQAVEKAHTTLRNITGGTN